MRVVFLGTPSFAVPTLETLVEAGHEVVLVVTQPDRPKGRGQQVAFSPVKEAALRLGLPVYQPERVGGPEGVERLRELDADAMVVVGYGQIIPQSIIDIAPMGIINVHASLLPKYRGAAPIQWAIVNGETVTGVTTMRIDAGLDTGDMLLKAETRIGPEETAIELGERLALMGAELLVRTLDGLAAGTISAGATGQRAGDACADHQEGRRPHRLGSDRAGDPQPDSRAAAWPGAYTTFRGQKLHVWKSRPDGASGLGAAGAVAGVEAAARGVRGGVAGIDRSADGRAETNFSGGLRQWAATIRK